MEDANLTSILTDLAILLVTFVGWLSDPFKGVKWRTGIKRSQLESPGIDMLYKMVSDPTAWKHEQTSRNFSKKRIIDGHFHLRFNIFFQRVFGIDELCPWILSKMQVLTLYQVIENPPEKMSAKMFDTLNFCFYKSWGIFPRGWVIWIIQLSTKKGILGGGFKYFLYSPLFGEDSHFD